jgi:hypothetical protein
MFDNFSWQSVVATLCVACALLFLIRRAIQFFRSQSCGGCGSACSGTENSNQPSGVKSTAFVSLESLQAPVADGEQQAKN